MSRQQISISLLVAAAALLALGLWLALEPLTTIQTIEDNVKSDTSSEGTWLHSAALRACASGDRIFDIMLRCNLGALSLVAAAIVFAGKTPRRPNESG